MERLFVAARRPAPAEPTSPKGGDADPATEARP
jgi:hypothetical protein